MSETEHTEVEHIYGGDVGEIPPANVVVAAGLAAASAGVPDSAPAPEETPED